jgi:RimJ/RimL family protein N-acetyltransferase
MKTTALVRSWVSAAAGTDTSGVRGLGFEAASATIAAGFEQLLLPVIGAETRPENVPAQALLIKLGLRPAGTNTEGWPVCQITREDWLLGLRSKIT